MEKTMETSTSIMTGYIGTTIRIHSFIPGRQGKGKWFGLRG